MKVLWITNFILPDLSSHLNKNLPCSGGWLNSSLKSLLDLHSNLTFAVATIYNGDIFREIEISGVIYYLLPLKGNNTKYQKKLETYWRKVIASFSPDLVHLHGTEFAHGLAFLNVFPNLKTVVSIQGLVSSVADYYLCGMSTHDIIRNTTFRDLLRGNLFYQRSQFIRRGRIEKNILSHVHYIIGRTSWDKANSLTINPSARYYYCNETLRPSFYKGIWKYDSCLPHTIFFSQFSSPIKGFHQLLKALPYVIKIFPDTKVIIAGDNILDCPTLKDKVLFSGYAKYLSRLIKKLNLASFLFFTGPLTENEVFENLLKSNLFVCSSSIENSPNSLAEAQIIGMPYIASYVGGVPDMMKKHEEWLYRYEEYSMLAQKIIQVFSLQDKVKFFDSNFLHRHNQKLNSLQLLQIYKDILNQN